MVLEEVAGIGQDLVLALGHDRDLEAEDPDLDLIQEVALSPDQTRGIVLNQDLQEIRQGQQETDLGPDRDPELRMPKDLRMETVHHLEKEMPQDLVLDRALVPDLDREVTRFGVTFGPLYTNQLRSNTIYVRELNI